MWPYWLMFMVPATAAFVTPARNLQLRARADRSVPWAWCVSCVALALLVGLRFEVGGDWFNYSENFDRLQYTELSEVLAMADPGYHLLSWASLQLGLGVVAVNVACGALFSYGLFSFCRSLPRPWLAVAVAIPYLVIVVGMGYTRQGVALACGMLGFKALQQRSLTRFVLWVLLGATFHRTAVLLLPVAAMIRTRNKFLVAVWVALISVVAYYLLLSESVDTLYAAYVEQQYQSEGALVRLAMNAVPAVILLKWGKRFAFPPEVAPLWRAAAWTSLALLAVLFTTPSSTAVDRIGLYMLPLQLVVFSQLPQAIGPRAKGKQQGVLLVLLYYAFVQFVWLNFAIHSQYWVPYRFYPLEEI